MTEAVVRILGIDPGTRHVGFGILEQRGFALTRIDSGCVHGGTGDMSERLLRIHRGLCDVIMRHAPDAAAIETVFASVNPKTAIAIGEGRGVAVLSAAEHGLRVCGYEPALVKKAVAGNGRAGKEQVRTMVKVLLNLPDKPATDHESDALAIAITHAMHCRLDAAGAAKNAVRSIRRGPRRLPEAVLRQLPPHLLAHTKGKG